MDLGSVHDLAQLPTLDAKTLLDHIKARYHNHMIYTYIGDILIALNPFVHLNIYGPDIGARYNNLRFKSDMPPHLYAVSDSAYQNLCRTGNNQCCVISGESGAGKTESTKIVVQHITQLCKHESSALHAKIVQVNPLLEAFGNAKTAINDNSSRFGKYIEIKFNTEGGLLGGKISEYLLEKSRVVGRGKGERNFHIFYYMFAGLSPEQLKHNLLDKPEYHRNVGTTSGYHEERWVSTSGKTKHGSHKHILFVLSCFQDIQGILAILAAILHITDLEFEYDQDSDGVYIKDESIMELAADMLGLPAEELAESLISNVTDVRGEKMISLKNIASANDGRDALAKALYARLFGWIVRQINSLLKGLEMPGNCIGILDLAGFENFEVNGFEQLCINAANEQLQFYFNQNVFAWELEEYKREGIKAKDVKFTDNRSLLDLFLKTPLGFFSLLDEESRFPQASDRTLLEKLNKNLNSSKEFSCSSKSSQNQSFTINHYAGQVVYHTPGFLEKNRDHLSQNLFEVMQNSESQFVADLFSSPISGTGALENKLVLSFDVIAFKILPLSVLRDQREVGSNSKLSTLTYYTVILFPIQNSLTELMAKLLDAEPHFIRCIKPNNMKCADLFQPELVSKQLQYTGVLETIKIRRQGFATRIPFEAFMERYKLISYGLTESVLPTAKNCTNSLKRLPSKDWEVGKNKVFLKYWHAEMLNDLIREQMVRIVHCQRFARGFIDRKRVRWLRKMSQQQTHDLKVFSNQLTTQGDLTFQCVSDQQAHDVQRLQEKVGSACPEVSLIQILTSRFAKMN
ncbi:hypothetical protein CAPTEDRAFT_115466 [Capitella teleta]|uniref:Myosin motor domain-containing protein n=1 Tax=Capitella teleta TaxID=283909 RepID=R7UVZ7_CAPTE|nr:hypothetical protein CAPTEDRAFT_115466 [Capitella teleta]|eukprot:ELU10798.1 hypothetical protein CAPTEDRAFT_115466 [Capitella teleta]